MFKNSFLKLCNLVYFWKKFIFYYSYVRISYVLYSAQFSLEESK